MTRFALILSLLAGCGLAPDTHAPGMAHAAPRAAARAVAVAKPVRAPIGVIALSDVNYRTKENPLGAVSLPWVSLLFDGVPDVVGGSAEKEMGHVHALRIVASVTGEHAIRNWTDEPFVHQSADEVIAVGVSSGGIPVLVKRSLPVPACGDGIDLDPLRKRFGCEDAELVCDPALPRAETLNPPAA